MVKLHDLCKTSHCLPSQLEKEDSVTIESFILIENELRTQEREKMDRMDAEMRLRGGHY